MYGVEAVGSREQPVFLLGFSFLCNGHFGSVGVTDLSVPRLPIGSAELSCESASARAQKDFIAFRSNETRARTVVIYNENVSLVVEVGHYVLFDTTK